MKNSELEKALKETWENKDKFYEDTKGLSLFEIVKQVENKYKLREAAYNQNAPQSRP